MSYHMPLPCSALAVWCWLNLRGANSAKRKPVIFLALTSRGKMGGRNNCSFVFKLKITQVVWNLPIWRNYFWHQLCFFWFGAWKNGVIKSCTLSMPVSATLLKTGLAPFSGAKSVHGVKTKHRGKDTEKNQTPKAVILWISNAATPYPLSNPLPRLLRDFWNLTDWSAKEVSMCTEAQNLEHWTGSSLTD